MSKPTIDLVWIVVADLKKAIAYYKEVVGLEVFVVDEKYGWAELGSSSGARLGIAVANVQDDLAIGSNAVITLTVQNLDQTTKEWVAKGALLDGDPQEVPGHVRLQMIKDPDGNQLQLVEMLGSHSS